MRSLLLPLLALTACATPPEHAPWIALFDGESLDGWQATNFGGEGPIVVVDGALELDFGSPLTGLTWTGTPPDGDYDLEVVAARVDGTDFFCGLTFPVRDAHLTLVLGGWGGSLCGISSLDGEDAANNDSQRLFRFENGRDYRVQVQVRRDVVDVFEPEEEAEEASVAALRARLAVIVDVSRAHGLAS